MAYPNNIDKFSDKLNKKEEGSVYVVEEALSITNGLYDGYLAHDNITNSSIRVYTGSKYSGVPVVNFVVSVPSNMPWRRLIRIFSDVPTVYVTYETKGDSVEADDINVLQLSMTNTQIEVDRYKTANDGTVSTIGSRVTAVETNKADKTYVDTQLLNKADKESTYTKTETDQRIEGIIGSAPDALDTLKELSVALNNDPNFASTMTTQLAGKVDKVAGKQLSTEDYTTSEKTKLAGIQEGATNYIHPDSHPATMITEDVTHRFATDVEKSTWNGKANTASPTFTGIVSMPNGVWDGSGNVGIGTISPAFPLDIRHSGQYAAHFQNKTANASQTAFYMENDRGSWASYGGFLYGSSVGNAGNLFGQSRTDKLFMFADGASNLGMFIGTLSAQPFVIGTNNVERMRVASDGAITMSNTLSVAGTVTIPSLNIVNDTKKLELLLDATYNAIFGHDYSANNNVLQYIFKYYSAGGYATQGIKLVDTGNGKTTVISQLASGKLYWVDGAGNAGTLVTGTWENPADSSTLKAEYGRWVFSSGNVGIGTNPTEKLEVSGNIKASGTITGSNLEYVANKGVANGYAGLDASGKVPAEQLPASSGVPTGGFTWNQLRGV
jgi:hypothetical protein